MPEEKIETARTTRSLGGASAELTITVPQGMTPGTHGAVILKSLHHADATHNVLPIAVVAQ